MKILAPKITVILLAACVMPFAAVAGEGSHGGAPTATRVAETATPEVREGFEKEYRDARKDETKARQALVKANGKSDRAQISLIEGERMISAASSALAVQQAAYKSFSARVGSATSAKAIASEVRALADIEKLWREAEDSYADGAKLVKTARKDLGEAEEARVKAEAKLAKAEMEMKAATVAPAPRSNEPQARIGDAESLLRAPIDVVPVSDAAEQPQ
jgi:hypothetical protein